MKVELLFFLLLSFGVGSKSFSLTLGPISNGHMKRFLSLNQFDNDSPKSINTDAPLSFTAYSQRLPITLPPHRLSMQQFIYVILSSTFITCLIIADIIGVKIFEMKFPFSIFGFSSIQHTCGMIPFPVTFLLGDIINEYYGPRATRQTVYIGFAMSVLVFIVMNIAEALPFLDKPFNGIPVYLSPSFYPLFFNLIILVTPFAFNSIFGSAKLMYVASVT
jgi:hypothetical protein